jgi:hypothetical protein
MDVQALTGIVIATLLGSGTMLRPRVRGLLRFEARWGDCDADEDDSPPDAREG